MQSVIKAIKLIDKITDVLFWAVLVTLFIFCVLS